MDEGGGAGSDAVSFGAVYEYRDVFGTPKFVGSTDKIPEARFREDVDQSLESNMDDIQLKQKAGGGIADNLAKLKKLKGGG